MTPEDWLAELAAVAEVPLTELVDRERDALLDVARVAAHTSQRWTAPLSTFLLGVALGHLDRDQRSDEVVRIATALDHAHGDG